MLLWLRVNRPLILLICSHPALTRIDCLLHTTRITLPQLLSLVSYLELLQRYFQQTVAGLNLNSRHTRHRTHNNGCTCSTSVGASTHVSCNCQKETSLLLLPHYTTKNVGHMSNKILMIVDRNTSQLQTTAYKTYNSSACIQVDLWGPT